MTGARGGEKGAGRLVNGGKKKKKKKKQKKKKKKKTNKKKKKKKKEEQSAPPFGRLCWRAAQRSAREMGKEQRGGGMHLLPGREGSILPAQNAPIERKRRETSARHDREERMIKWDHCGRNFRKKAISAKTCKEFRGVPNGFLWP